MQQTSQVDSLSLRFKLLFSTGDLSTSIPLTVLMFFQLYFLTDIAGLRPDHAGLAVAIGKIWDSINDPIFGLLSDRIRSRLGRRRVVLLFSAVPLGLTFMLIWLVPPFGEMALVAYYALTFILFDTVFTLVHVSYNALTPEMTRDYDERSSLNGFRMVYSTSGNLLSIVLVTVLGWYVSDMRTLFMWVGIGLGVFSMIPVWIVFSVTKEKPPEEMPAPMPIMQAIRYTLRNRPFWMVMGLYLFSWTTASILATVLIYYANYYLRVPEQANYFILVAQGCAILFVPFWVKIARVLDKKRAFILGMASWIVVLGSIALLSPSQVPLAYILAALAGSGIATAYVLPWSMIPDVVELDEVETGQRREGSFYAFASFFQKLATGVAVWVLGVALTSTGYITPTTENPLPVQPPQAVDAIRLTIGAVPALLCVFAILLAWLYPITRERHRELREELSARD